VSNCLYTSPLHGTMSGVNNCGTGRRNAIDVGHHSI